MIRKLIIITTILMGCVSVVANDTPLNTNALLKSIGEVETGGRYWKIGGAGERSLYQIKGTTWNRYSRVPFKNASQKSYQSEAKRVAKCYINDILVDVEHDGHPVDAKNVALRWNGGINRVKFRQKTWVYASHVSNLYVIYRNEKEVEQPNQPPTLKITISLPDDILITPATPASVAPTITFSKDLVFYPPVIAVL